MSPDLGKQEMLIKNATLANFPLLKSNSLCAGGFVCLLISSRALRKRRRVKCELVVMGKSRSWKKRNAQKNEELTNFLHLKAIPLCRDGFVHFLMPSEAL